MIHLRTESCPIIGSDYIHTQNGKNILQTTQLLNFVICLNMCGILIGSIITNVFLFLAILYPQDRIAFLILLISVLTYSWLTYELALFNNKAKIGMIIIIGTSLLLLVFGYYEYSLLHRPINDLFFDLPIINLHISFSFISLYTLLFHKPTLNLFNPLLDYSTANKTRSNPPGSPTKKERFAIAIISVNLVIFLILLFLWS